MSYHIFLKEESYDSATIFVLTYQAKQMLTCLIAKPEGGRRRLKPGALAVQVLALK